MSEPKPLTMLGDADAASCVDGVCEVPGSHGHLAGSGSVMSATVAPNDAMSAPASTSEL